MQRRYVHGLVSEIVVDREKAVIAGPRAAIAAAITSGNCKEGVRSFVREWRPLAAPWRSVFLSSLRSTQEKLAHRARFELATPRFIVWSFMLNINGLTKRACNIPSWGCLGSPPVTRQPHPITNQTGIYKTALDIYIRSWYVPISKSARGKNVGS